jgi:DNA polymerase-3 subunit gamma/tau
VSSQTKANIYRPQVFEDVLGQSIWVPKLAKRIAEDRLPSVIIIGGPSGTGKTTTAKIVAKSLVCMVRQNGEHNPCNACDGCRSVDDGSGMNFMFMDGGMGDLADLVRNDLKTTMEYAPAMGSRYKACIIDEFQAFSGAAKSALLVIFEELSSRSVIICTTTDVKSIHEALRDRAYEIDFGPIPVEDQVKGVLKFEPELEDYLEEITFLAKNSGGTQRRLWSMIDRLDGDFSKETLNAVIGGCDESERLDILHSAFKRDFARVDRIWSSWLKKGHDVTGIGEQLLEDLCKLSIKSPNNIQYTKGLKILSQAAVLGKPEMFRRSLLMLPEDKPVKVDVTLPTPEQMYKGIFSD